MENTVFKFRTFIKKDHKLGGRDYIVGRISGIMYCMCQDKNDISYGIAKDDSVVKLIVKCTKEQYDAFSEVIEDMYPGLCVFNAEEPK